MAWIDVSKKSALIEEKLEILVGGLNALQDVTVTAWCADRGRVYASSAAFTADIHGQVDLTTAASQAGTYTGISSMGMFWSMKPTLDMKKGSRLLKFDVTTPLVTQLSVYPGHVSIINPRTDASTPLATESISRLYMADDVKRIEVQHDGLIGTLFVPEGGSDVPGVIDVFGSVGGIIEYRAALLASRGFVTLALGYIDYENMDLPIQKDMGYFEKAVDFLCKHPKVQGNGIGMVGVSKGSEICLLLASLCPKVQAVISIGGTPWITGCTHTYKGLTFPHTGVEIMLSEETGKFGFVKMDGYEQVDGDEGIFFRFHQDKMPKESFILVQNTHAKLLLISGDDDPYGPNDTAYLLRKTLRHAGRADMCKMLRYRRAGHLIEPPYSPHCRAAHIPNVGLYHWGGYTAEHAYAQEDSWGKMLNFLRETLSNSLTPHSKL